MLFPLNAARTRGALAGLALFACLARPVNGPARAQTATSSPEPAEPFVTLLDRFGRDISRRGVTLVDWEGHIANPACLVRFRVSPIVRRPARVVLSANGPRLMFDLFSEVGAGGPQKTIFLEQPQEEGEFWMAVFPDRDATDETYGLKFEVTTANGARANAVFAVQVLDQDRARPVEYDVTLDLSHDQTGFFSDPAVARIARQAVADWAYFFQGGGGPPVQPGDEVSWMWDANGFSNGAEIRNELPFRDLLLYLHGMNHPDLHSGAMGSDRAGSGFQTRDGRRLGLRRSGTVSIETRGNWGTRGWLLDESDDEWHRSGNNFDEKHDLYSVLHHELGHAFVFHHDAHTAFDERTRDGTFRDAQVERYLGRAPAVDRSVDHFIDVVDPVSRFGAFGNEYGSMMPVKRWLITKFDLLAAQACGYRLRDTTPFRPLALAGPDRIALRREPLREAATSRSAARATPPSAASPKAGWSAAGGVPPYCFTVDGRLPEGLNVDRWTGELTGAAQQAGTYEVQLMLRDNDPTAGPVSRRVTVVVEP